VSAASEENAAAFEVTTHESLRDLGESEYASVLPDDVPPFLTYSWLDALEQARLVTPERGWAPCHIALRQGGKLRLVAPAYVKGNSEGEFVFDHAWARFAEMQLGIAYYPKLIVAVPFTPATGPRLLCREVGASRDVLVSTFASALGRLSEALELSGVHVLFPPDTEASELSKQGLLLRHGLQFHWHNPGYTSFDDFLSRFSSKRRNQIRRERRAMQEQNIEIRTYTGSDIKSEQVDLAYEFYRVTVDKFYWGRRYLTRDFFHDVAARMPEQLHIVLAFERGSQRALGGAFNLLGKHALYGRYWGAREERPFLHFNVCFYHSIEECIARKLPLFEPGAGGEHKASRGFEPTLTQSVHHLRDRRLARAIDDFLTRERHAHVLHIEEAARDSVLKCLPSDEG
jgi:predicted N-acyltransferase